MNFQRLRGKSKDPAVLTVEAFPGFYIENHERVLRYLARRVLDPEVAFDLMAETFAEMFAHIDSFRGTTEAELQAWMWTITRNQLYRWRDRGKAERRAVAHLGLQTPDLEETDFEAIEELADLQSRLPEIERALSELSSTAAVALQLRIVDGLSYDDISARLGVSPQVVRLRVSRGLRQLAQALALTNINFTE